MIKVNLKLPDALETLSAIQLQSARDIIRASELVDKDSQWAAMLSQRAERLNAIAREITTAIVLQRGITEP